MRKDRLGSYLLSLPERAVRSATALSAGLLREIGEVSIPQTVRKGQLYQNLVESTLRFLIEQVGQVEGVYPTVDKLSEEFLVRRTAGNGIELIGILTFHASPVWVLAGLADATGAGRFLISEIAESLKAEGLLDRDGVFNTVDQMLDGLESSAGRLASAINTPPLDVASLRAEWSNMRRDLSNIPPKNLPSLEDIRKVWGEMNQVATQQNRSLFELSSVMAMSALSDLPETARQKVRWMSASARVAMQKTGLVTAAFFMDHYQTTLKRIREIGYVTFAVSQYRPYLFAAVSQFAPTRQTLTERVLGRKRSP